MVVAEKNASETTEKVSLKGFREEVGEHGLSWTMDHLNIVEMKTVGDPKVTNIDMTRTLSTRSTTVAFQLDRAFVVLGELAGQDWIALSLHEIHDPNCIG